MKLRAPAQRNARRLGDATRVAGTNARKSSELAVAAS